MTAENIMAAVIVCICSLPIIIIGIAQYRSKEPVWFWSGKKPPEREQVTYVKAYNRKHGVMWLIYGIGFLLCFFCGWPFGGSIAAILSSAECIGGIFVMILYHNRLDRRYLKKEKV